MAIPKPRRPLKCKESLQNFSRVGGEFSLIPISPTTNHLVLSFITELFEMIPACPIRVFRGRKEKAVLGAHPMQFRVSDDRGTSNRRSVYVV